MVLVLAEAFDIDAEADTHGCLTEAVDYFLQTSGLRLLVLKNIYLRDQELRRLVEDKDKFCILSPSMVTREALIKACYSHGHLNIFFCLPNEAKSKSLKNWRHEGSFALANDGRGPMTEEHFAQFQEAIASFELDEDYLYSFTHDASTLVCITLKGTD